MAGLILPHQVILASPARLLLQMWNDWDTVLAILAVPAL